MEEKLVLSDAEWKARLSPEQYQVLRRKGTEAPFCGGYVASKEHGAGTYHCAGCGSPLFISGRKFESGTGWPSFWEPLPGRVEAEPDRSHGMERTEVHCARCGGHLGHRFDDGPPPSGQRYCINSVSLAFVPFSASATAAGTAKATFAAGCFWGVEASLRAIPGVIDTQVGYTGGTLAQPTYEEVCGHGTGHAEAVEVTYDPTQVSFDNLLERFFALHDPTQIDRQGPDVGDQYRSAVFVHSPEQRRAVEAMKERLTREGRYKRPIATRIEEAGPFWRAEDHHQRYLEKRGLANCHH